MSRPYKTRCIARLPGVTVFKPAGIPARELTRVEVHFDELEALRLVDGEALNHAQAAERMKVSRPTVGRILERVRKKIAQALVEGKALFIEQGDAPIEHVGAARKPRGGQRRRSDEAKSSKTTGKST
jgi:predicted DNA-binding protein (UPF0251 family)